MKNLSLCFVVAGAFVTPAFGCDLCSIYSANQAHGDVGHGFFGGVAEQFTHFGTLQTDGVKGPNDEDQYLDSSISQLFAGYNFNDHIGLQFNVPLVYRSFQRPDGAGGTERGTESGIADVSILANLRPYRYESVNFTFNWNVVGGIKLPTGSTGRLHEEVDELTAPPPPPGAPDSGIHGHDLTLGSGSVDEIFGTGVFARWKRFYATASTQFTLRSSGDFDYRFANDLTWSGGPGYFALLEDNYTLSVQAVVSGETKGRDRFQGSVADDTGVTSVFLGPEVNFTWSDKVSAAIGADLPVSIDNTSFQSVPDYRIHASFTWHF